MTQPSKKIKGTPLNYNAGLAENYYADLARLIKRMTTYSEKEMRKLFDGPVGEAHFAEDASMSSQARILANALEKKFDDLFAFSAKTFAERMTENASKASKSGLYASLEALAGGTVIKSSLLAGGVNDILKATIAGNVNLIRSIPTLYFSKINNAVFQAISNGRGLADLVPFFQKQEGITLRKAKLLASDQTRKAYANLNAERMQNIGFDEYVWLHSGGGHHPRHDHEEMNGKTYSLKDPPIIDKKTGQRGKPGDLINCRCRMNPVIDFTRLK